MSGTVRKLISRSQYNFSDMATSTTMSVIALRSVDVTHGETAELCVRVHAIDNDTGDNKIRVVATTVSLTPEEPDTDFLGDEVANVDIGTTYSAGALLIDSFTQPFGAAIQLSVDGVKGATEDNLSATISVDLVLRD